MAATRHEILGKAQARMRAQGLSQRQLALLLDVSQGHLSKVLRGEIERDGRAFVALESWVASPVSALEAGLLRAARRATGGKLQGFQLLIHLMHLIADLRDGSSTQRKRRARV